MDREDKRSRALADFRERIVLPRRKERLLLLEELYQSRRETLAEQFLQGLGKWCADIGELQARGDKGRIGTIAYGLLRTQLLEGRLVYMAEAADSGWFMDASPVHDYYDASWALAPWTGWLDELEQGRREYQGLLTALDAEKEWLLGAANIQPYITALIRYAMPVASELEAVQSLEKEDLFEVRVGEFRDFSEVVYRVDRRQQDEAAVRARLEKQQAGEDSGAYGHFYRINLSSGDYGGQDFRFARFDASDLSGAVLEGSILAGSLWENSSLEEADLSESWLSGASFEACNLRNADLQLAAGMPGIAVAAVPGQSVSESSGDAKAAAALDYAELGPGWQGVSFARSDLSGADLSAALLPGASFAGANLSGVKFWGANLEDADFRGAVLQGTDFFLARCLRERCGMSM